ITDIARAIAPELPHQIVGIRPGEKLHEIMICEDDARKSLELKDRYVILPPVEWQAPDREPVGKPCPEGFRYASDNNIDWMALDELRKNIAAVELPEAKEWARKQGL